MCREIKRVSRFPLFKLLDYLVSIQQLKMVDLVFTGSEFGLDQLRKLGREKPVVSTGIGIDMEEFQDDPLSDEQKIWDGLFVGRMAPEKGVFDLLRIWRKVVDEIPDARLAVVGKTVKPYYNEWLSMLKDMQLERNVSHLGELERKELIRTYYSSRVFVFPSKIEGAGIVIAEAMAAGLPVVAWNLPAYKTLYDKAPAFYLFDDNETMSAKVVELLKDINAARMVGLLNRSYAINKFSWRNVSRKVTEKMELLNAIGNKLADQGEKKS